MNAIVLLSIIGIGLFVLSFISKRRFGLLGLALAAGAILSQIWSYEAELIVSTSGIVPNGQLTAVIASSVMVLLPSVILLFHSSKYHSMLSRIIGSLLYSLLALAFLVEPLGKVLDLSDINQITSVKSLIISVGLVFAIVDLFMTKKPESGKKSKH